MVMFIDDVLKGSLIEAVLRRVTDKNSDLVTSVVEYLEICPYDLLVEEYSGFCCAESYCEYLFDKCNTLIEPFSMYELQLLFSNACQHCGAIKDIDLELIYGETY